MNRFDLAMDSEVHEHLEIDLGDTLLYVNVFEIDVPKDHYHVIIGNLDKSGKIKYNKQEHFLDEKKFIEFAEFLDEVRRKVSIRRSHRMVENIRMEITSESDKQTEMYESDTDHVSKGPNLFRDIIDSQTIKTKMRSSKDYCKRFYGTMTNTDLYKEGHNGEHGFSFRSAGGLVADILGEGDYLDWYCSHAEGVVDPEVQEDLNAIGWTVVEMDVDMSEYKQEKLFKPEL